MANNTFVLEIKRIYKVPVILAFLIFVSGFPSSLGGISMGFYDFSCPSVEYVVRNTVRSAALKDASVPGKLLRLLFHDCFVEGCDASVLIEGEGTEREDPGNASLGGFEVIESAKREIENFCPGTVSCADILALAARDAVALTGGPDVQISTGRLDGRVSEISNVRPNIIDTSFTLDDMMAVFNSKGLSLEDIVILSGAHTIGSAHCNGFNERFKISSNGTLKFVDSTLDKTYAHELAKTCLKNTSAMVTIDPKTPLYFDSQYYNNLKAHKGLFQTDSILFADKRTRNMVDTFAVNISRFHDGWYQSFIKLSSIDVKTSADGEIRQTCSRINV